MPERLTPSQIRNRRNSLIYFLATGDPLPVRYGFLDPLPADDLAAMFRLSTRSIRQAVADGRDATDAILGAARQ